MNGLERELRGLAAAVEWPPTPEIASAVSARVAGSAPPRAPWWRRREVLAVALATLAAAVVATLAVPPARTAVLRWLGIGSVRIVYVDDLPPAAELPPVALLRTLPGTPVSPAVARRAVSFTLLDPPSSLGRPARLLLLRDPGIVTYVWGDPAAPRLTVTQLPGSPAPWLVGKLIPPGATVQELRQGGRRAVWISGAPHRIAVLDPRTAEPIYDSARLAGNTLLVDRGELTLRVEGDLTRAQALRIARAFG